MVPRLLPRPEKAEFNFAWLTAPGTAVLVAALLSMVLLGMKRREVAWVYQRTFFQMKIPIPTIAFMLGLSSITRFAGMPSNDMDIAPLMFTGIQILEPRIFDYIPPGVFSDTVVDVYPQAIAKGERVLAHVAEGMWFELSTLQRYLDISLALLREQGRDLYTGRNPAIDSHADVRESVFWDDVRIERGAVVRRAILGDRVRIREGELIENSVVVRNEVVAGKNKPSKALSGETRGENFVVSLSQ